MINFRIPVVASSSGAEYNAVVIVEIAVLNVSFS